MVAHHLTHSALAQTCPAGYNCQAAASHPPLLPGGAPGQGFHAGHPPLAPPAVRGRLEAAPHTTVPFLLAAITLGAWRSAAAATAACRHRGRAGAAGGRGREAGTTAAGSIAAGHGSGRLPRAVAVASEGCQVQSWCAAIHKPSRGGAEQAGGAEIVHTALEKADTASTA